MVTVFFFGWAILLRFAYSDVLLSDPLQRLPGTCPVWKPLATMISQTTRPSGRFCQEPGRKAHWTSLRRDRRRQPGQPHKGWVWDALAQQPSRLNRDHMSRGWSIQSSLWAAADLSVWEREGDAQVWEPSSDPFPATPTPTSAQSRLTGLLAALDVGRSGADQKKWDLHSGDRLRVPEGPQPGATAQCSVKTIQERYLIKALLFIAITCSLVFQFRIELRKKHHVEFPHSITRDKNGTFPL